MSFTDFLDATPGELYDALMIKNNREENMHKGQMESLRTSTILQMQIHTKKKLNPRKVWPLPWDKKQVKNGNKPKRLKREDWKKLENKFGKTSKN